MCWSMQYRLSWSSQCKLLFFHNQGLIFYWWSDMNQECSGVESDLIWCLEFDFAFWNDFLVIMVRYNDNLLKQVMILIYFGDQCLFNSECATLNPFWWHLLVCLLIIGNEVSGRILHVKVALWIHNKMTV